MTLWQDTLAVESNNLATVLLRLERYAEALEASTLSVATARELIAADGPRSRWTVKQSQVKLQLGRALASAQAYPKMRSPKNLDAKQLPSCRA